jgi:multidrug efflux pump subunit AcrB
VQPLPEAAGRAPECLPARSERIFDGVRDVYGGSLRGVLHHRALTMLMAAGMLAGTVYLYRLLRWRLRSASARGAEARRLIGLAVAGGLVVPQLLTL